jgi:hypothetical protein
MKDKGFTKRERFSHKRKRFLPRGRGLSMKLKGFRRR